MGLVNFYIILNRDYAAAGSVPGEKTVLMASFIADLSGEKLHITNFHKFVTQAA